MPFIASIHKPIPEKRHNKGSVKNREEVMLLYVSGKSVSQKRSNCRKMQYFHKHKR